jgi:putative cardiolipin synthase
MNLDPRSADLNTEVDLVIESPVLARQGERVFRLALRADSYRLRLADDAARVEWVSTDWAGRETVHRSEPHDDAWLRLKLWLLRPFVAEELL